MPPAGIAGAGLSSFLSAITHSVVEEQAGYRSGIFKSHSVTFAGSITPATSRFSRILTCAAGIVTEVGVAILLLSEYNNGNFHTGWPQSDGEGFLNGTAYDGDTCLLIVVALGGRREP